jgi:hypothetical protein
MKRLSGGNPESALSFPQEWRFNKESDLFKGKSEITLKKQQCTM